MDRTVTINQDQMVLISFEMVKRLPKEGQGFIEFLLANAIRTVTGVDFFKAEALKTESDEKRRANET